VCTEVGHASLDGSNRASDGLPGYAVRNGVALNGIFLVDILHRDAPSGAQGFQWRNRAARPCSAVVQGDVAEAERGREGVVGVRVDDFAGSINEKESEIAHIGNGKVVLGSCLFVDWVDDGKRDGLSARWWEIAFFMSFPQPAKVGVCVAKGVESFILGPQVGHRLADGTYGVLHCSSSYGVTIFGKGTVAGSLGKNFEEDERVLDIIQ
jgi:hypothetical protein